jgi:broad specificity phosphatase PhoE
VKVFLIHHAEVPNTTENPQAALTPKGRDQCDRLGERLRAIGVTPSRILHSDKTWCIETAKRIAAKMGMEDRLEQPSYGIHTGFPIAPFIAEVRQAKSDLMMCGHTEFITRAAGMLVAGDEARKVVEFRPGFNSLACLQGEGDTWSVFYVWRHEHPPG